MGRATQEELKETRDACDVAREVVPRNVAVKRECL